MSIFEAISEIYLITSNLLSAILSFYKVRYGHALHNPYTLLL